MIAKETVMRSTWMLVLAAVFLSAADAARAEEAQQKYDPRAAFAETDTNHDGIVDRQEFDVRIVEVFYRADVNKDGFLSAEEIARLTFPDDMKNADSNGDGRISLHEFERVRELDFETADRNKDGVLSVDEVIAVYEVKSNK
jgi:Ca2+-binding EF-hand superfamily protein